MAIISRSLAKRLRSLMIISRYNAIEKDHEGTRTVPVYDIIAIERDLFTRERDIIAREGNLFAFPRDNIIAK